MRGRTDEEFWAAFWDKVDRRAPSECWPWKGRLLTGGYGAARAPREWRPAPGTGPLSASSLAWSFVHQAVPLGKRSRVCVMHSCDFRPCCNPAHLSIATELDNMRDMYTKGRAAYGSAPGEANRSAKLSVAQVLEIRRRTRAGEACRVVANEFGVFHSTARQIRNGTRWRCVPDSVSA